MLAPAAPIEAPNPVHCFQTTHWSVVLAAGEFHSSQASPALERLCQVYWYPVFAYIRRCGKGPHDAQDLTQEFFAYLIRRKAIAAAAPARGRFRSFLLACLKHFLADDNKRGRAEKRGGDRDIVSFDAEAAEGRYGLEPVEDETPETLFERRWVLELLDTVFRRLESQFRESRKWEQFEELRRFVVADRFERDSYADAAGRLGMNPEAFKKSLQRFRHRYQEILRQEIERTVASPQEIEDEYRYLRRVLNS